MNSSKLSYIDEQTLRRISGKKRTYDVVGHEFWPALEGEMISPACTYLPLYTLVKNNRNSVANDSKTVETQSQIRTDNPNGRYYYSAATALQDMLTIPKDVDLSVMDMAADDGSYEQIETLVVPMKEWLKAGVPFVDGSLAYFSGKHSWREAVEYVKMLAKDSKDYDGIDLYPLDFNAQDFPKKYDRESTLYLLQRWGVNAKNEVLWQVPNLGKPGTIYEIPDNLTWMIGYNIYNYDTNETISPADLQHTIYFSFSKKNKLPVNLLVVKTQHSHYIPTKFREAYTPLYIYRNGTNYDLTATGQVVVCSNRKIFAECLLVTNSENLFGNHGCSLDEWASRHRPEFVWVCLNGSAALDGAQVSFRSAAWDYETAARIVDFQKNNRGKTYNEFDPDAEEQQPEEPQPQTQWIDRNPYSAYEGTSTTVAVKDGTDITVADKPEPETETKATLKTNNKTQGKAAGLLFGLLAASLLLKK